MWRPFFFGVIPTYGVLPYAMIGRCISAVHIRQCSAGVRQQCFVAGWLELSVTVRLGLGLGPGDEILSFFFFFFFFVDVFVGALLACTVGVARQYDVIGHEAWWTKWVPIR